MVAKSLTMFKLELERDLRSKISEFWHNLEISHDDIAYANLTEIMAFNDEINAIKIEISKLK